jgi:uncharacterized protein (DUF2141 family)
MNENMKAVSVGAIVSFALALSSAPAYAQSANAKNTCTLIVHVDGFRNQKGDVGVSLFTSPDGWPEKNDKAFLHGPHPFSGFQTTVTLEVPPGRYGIAVIHDENSNHKLDRNFIGIPKEGFGFANNPKVFLTAPDFKAASIEVGCPTTETTIRLNYK